MPAANTATTPSFYFNGYRIDSFYAFSAYSNAKGIAKNNKVWLDMLFMDPVKEEAVAVKVVKDAMILCQPKAAVEAIAQREIHHFLSRSFNRAGKRRKQSATA